MKPYFDDGKGRVIYCGDSREIAPTLGPQFAVVSDPPYGISYLHSGGGLGLHRVRNLTAIVGDNAPFDPAQWIAYPRALLWGADRFAPRLPSDRGCWIAWDKAANGGPEDYFCDAEFAWCSERTPRNVFRVQWKGIANHKAEEPLPRAHPSQKPLKLMRACLAAIGGTEPILDPFLGSGITLLAAKEFNRPAIGIEIEERYCEIAARRLEQEVFEFHE